MALAAVGAIGSILKAVDSGQGILKNINVPSGNFYSVRMENGDSQDAAGNPPSIIFTDFSDTKIFGVFEGSAKANDEMCRNNKDLPIGDFDSPDLQLFRGLKRGEAPIQNFQTQNGFNLKSIDIQPGSNDICLSNIIIKGSDTQARRDEIFIPIGNLGFECGFEWNWGTILGQERQRCLWLDGADDGPPNRMRSLHLDMEKIAGIFNKDKGDVLKASNITQLCTLFNDNVGEIPNRNDCAATVKKQQIPLNTTVIDTVSHVKISSNNFKSPEIMNNFAGSGFVTSDQKFYNSETNSFQDVTVVPDGSGKAGSENAPAKDNLNSRSFRRDFRVAEKIKREKMSDILKVQSCTAVVDGTSPKCVLDETIRVDGTVS